MDLIIVDDNKKFLEALSFFVSRKLKHKVLAEYDSPLDFIESPYIRVADCILLDIEMPGMNGIETAKKILKDDRETKFIAVTNHIEKAYMLDLICAGFMGCVFKNTLFDKLEEAIINVVEKKYYFPDGIKLNREYK
jgi:DNA-binding NarL/FixJ family response regulator